MRYAVVKLPGGGTVLKANAYVDNVIVGKLSDDDLAAFELSLDALLLDAAPLGLCIGDLYNGANWTRNVDGAQTALPIEIASQDAMDLLNIIEGTVE